MMMTSGGAVHYKSMFDAGSQIVAKEGTKSLFKGAGANILRGVAGAGVLSLYDKLQELMFGKVYSVRRRLLQSRPKVDMGSRVVPVKRVPDVYTSTTRNPSTYRSSTSSPFSRCYRFIHPLQCLFYPHDLLLDLFSLASAVRMWLRKLDMQMWDTLRSSALALHDHDHEDRDLRHHAISAEFVVQYPGSQRSIPPRIERFVTRNLSPS